MAAHESSTIVSQLSHVVPFPITAVEQITQSELAELIEARNVLAQLKAKVEGLESGIKTRLEAGASVETGVHVAELKENFRRSVAWKEIAERLAGKLYGQKRAEAYCDNVLKNTKPTHTVSLAVF